MLYRITFLSLLLVLSASKSWAKDSCMSYAVTLQEQVYCQIKSEGKGSQLPAFNDFQKNDMFIQYLLLKADARDLGIDLPKISKNTQTHKVVEDRKISLQASPKTAQEKDPDAGVVMHEAKTCDLVDEQKIVCGVEQYHLQKNKKNQALRDGALSERNLLGLSEYLGDNSDGQGVEEYLATSYGRYLEKMLDIGLGGSTMSYGKFYAIYFNLLEQQVNFAERFEVMFRYLKKDKKTMAVNTSLPIPKTLAISDCFEIEEFWVCNRERKNLVFKKV